MIEHNRPRPVAWEGWHATVTGERPREGRPGCVDVQEFDEGEHGDVVGRDYAMTPAEAELHGLALIMAAAVARGEQGHTAALNRVAAVLDNAPADERAEQVDLLLATVADLREDLDAANTARAEAVQEATRLRVELAEAREALAGKTTHDVAAEVVAPLRDALALCGEGVDAAAGPRQVVAVATLRLLRTRAPDAPAREPMTHTSLASIEEHGVVVGDRLEQPARLEHAAMQNAAFRMGLGLRHEHGGVVGPGEPQARWALESFPLTVVEAHDDD